MTEVKVMKGVVMKSITNMKNDASDKSECHYSFSHITSSCMGNIKSGEILVCAVKYIAYIAVRKISNLFYNLLALAGARGQIS